MKTNTVPISRFAKLLTALSALFALASPAELRAGDPEFEMVYEFENGPRKPSEGVLTAAGGGWHWGATSEGGRHNQGTLYRVRADGSGMEVMHEFALEEGGLPFASLWNDQAGYLWGTTGRGGAGGAGTIFKVHAATGVLTVALHLPVRSGGYADGVSWGGLTGDNAGNLWGTTFSPASVFKFNIASGELTTVHDFTAGSGAPIGSMMRDEHGMLWGVTSMLSAAFAKTNEVFKVNPATGSVTIAARFLMAEQEVKGGPLNMGLTSDKRGNVWGAAYAYGPGNGGTVFKISMATGELTIAGAFGAGAGAVRGYYPSGNMAVDDHGFLWGTTGLGGRFGGGTIFRIDPATGSIETMLDFEPGTANDAWNGLIRTESGDLMGTVHSQEGAVFIASGTDGSIKRLTKIESAPVEGGSKGREPHAELTVDSAGKLWGTARAGGEHGLGTIFQMDAANGRIIKEISFTGESGPVKGESPAAPLVSDGRGFLWSTVSGSREGEGFLYKVNENTAKVVTVMTFTTATGLTPLRGLALDGAGWLWGATETGGRGERGTLYKVNAATHEFRLVQEFATTSSSVAGLIKGVRLRGNLKSDGAGAVWGAAYETNATTSNDILCRFDWTTGEFHRELVLASNVRQTLGFDLHPAITRGVNGTWWAATRDGGRGNNGALFTFDPATGEAREKTHFSGAPLPMLSDSGAALLYDRRKIWGVALGHKSNAAGAILCFDTETGEESTIREFSGWSNYSQYDYDIFSNSALIRHPDGNLYGTVRGGGEAKSGFVYRLRFRADVETLPATELTESQATLRGRISPEGIGPVRVKLEYSPSPAMTNAVTAGVFEVENSEDFTGISMTATELVPGMTYYCRAVSLTEQGGQFPAGEVLPFTVAGTLNYAGWKSAFRITGTADDSDGDGDGYSALLEYGLAMSPVDADSKGTGPQAALVSGANGTVLSLTLLRDPSRRDVTIAVEAASDPAGPWEELARSAGGAPFTGEGLVTGESPGPGVKTVEVRDIHAAGGEGTAARRFVRVKVQKD